MTEMPAPTFADTKIPVAPALIETTSAPTTPFKVGEAVTVAAVVPL